MRLKILFFPIVLIISLSIFIGFIWPEISSVRKLNENRIAKNSELQSVAGQQSAIELARKNISDNIEGNKIVNDYLPENKTEERVIAGINYLAADAGVSLVNISLTGTIDKKSPVSTEISTIDQLTESKVNSVQLSSAKISLIGDYEKIRIFFDNLQRMPIFNVIKSVKIARQTSVSDAGDEAVANDFKLAVEAVVDFGYLSVAKVNNKQVEKFNANIDNETMNSLTKYISQKSQLVEDNNAETSNKGKANPFFIN